MGLYLGLLTDTQGNSVNLHFRWQAALHRVTDWYTGEQCSLQVLIYFVADLYSGIHSRWQATIPKVTDKYTG